MLESILNPELRQKLKSKARRAITTALIPLSFLTLSCGKDISVSQEQQSQQQTTKTDTNGLASILLEDYKLNIKVSEEATSIPLPSIDLGVINFENCYGLLALDPSNIHNSDLSYLIFSQASSKPQPLISTIAPDSFKEDAQNPASKISWFRKEVNLSLTMSKASEKLTIHILPNSPLITIPKFSKKEKIATIPLSQLYNFYKEHDDLVENAKIYDLFFSVSEDYFNMKGIKAASELNTTRTKFLENISELTDQVTNTLIAVTGVNGRYEPEAHYWDIYAVANPIKYAGPILTHIESQDRLCTLKIKTYVPGTNNQKVQVPISTLTSLRVKAANKTYQQETLSFTYFNLPEDLYLLTPIAQGIKPEPTQLSLKFPTPPFFTSTNADIILKFDPTSNTRLRTKTLQTAYQEVQTALLFDFESNISVKAEGEFNPPPALWDLYIRPIDPQFSSPLASLENIIYMGNIPLERILLSPQSGYVRGYIGKLEPGDDKQTAGVGSSFVVKTMEGNFAKLRITNLDRSKHLMQIEYKLTSNSQGVFIN